ncbi:MAG: hypothetical protein J6Z45_04595 [Oscillospiraceae bacterium]|nr:hypothetical protein [Oscillospiraceae bacterium]
MKITKAFRLSAAVGAAVLLTACTKETDLSQRYPEFLQYCFGDRCSIHYEKKASSQDRYSIEYWMPFAEGGTPDEMTVQADDGLYYEVCSRSYGIEPYKKSGYADVCTKEEYYDLQLESLVEEELQNRYCDLMTERIIQPHLAETITEDTESGSYRFGTEGQNGKIILRVAPLINYSDPESEVIKNELFSPGTGIQICRPDFAQLLQDERLSCILWMGVNPDEDMAAYEEKFRNIAADFRQLGAKNYTLLLRKGISDGSIVFREDCILGEPVDFDARKAAWTGGDDYTITADQSRCLIEKRKNT